MNKTSIEWTTYTSNPIKFRNEEGKVVWGCVKASEGCQNCYANTLAHRYHKGDFTASAMAKLTPFVDDKELRSILTKKTQPGELCFLGDMTDIFGPWVTDAMLDQVFAAMALRPDLIFQLLTKRPERMREYMKDEATRGRVAQAMDRLRTPLWEGEEFLPLAGFPGYFVSTLGRVLSGKRGGDLTVMAGDIGEQGHIRVTLQGPDGRARKLVHRLVLETFVGPPPDDAAQACHLNGNARDNRISNLRWGSQSDNWEDRKRHGHFRSYSKLDDAQVKEIRQRGKAGESAYSIAKDFPVSDTQVRNLIKGAQWVTEAGVEWPLPNCWLGTSVENQHWAEIRIPELIATPAAVRFISAEPLLGPVDLHLGLPVPGHQLLGVMLTQDSGRPNVVCTCGEIASGVKGQTWSVELAADRRTALISPSFNWPGHFHTPNPVQPAVIQYGDWFRTRIDWVIAGGESGPGARPCDIAWLRSIVQQCQAATVPVFCKQLGSKPVGWYCDNLYCQQWDPPSRHDDGTHTKADGARCIGRITLSPRLLNRKGGNPNEWPEDLRVRELPEVRNA